MFYCWGARAMVFWVVTRDGALADVPNADPNGFILPHIVGMTPLELPDDGFFL